MRLPVIFVAALALRAWFLWMYVLRHPARALGTIPFLFEPGNIAYAIATGHGFSSPFRIDTGPTAWMTPVYPLVLAGIFRVFGTYSFHAFVAAAGLNVVFSALTCIPLFLAARRIAGDRVAVAATWLWAVFPNAILLPYESLWEASLAALIATAVLWWTLTVAESGRIRDWCIYGLLWGLALMTNAALVALLPFLFGWAEYRQHRKGKFSFARPALAAGMVVLCCIPWAVRNYRVFHAFVPLRSVAGLALWMGNNDQADTTNVGKLHPISNQTERDRYVELGEIEYMREKQGLAVDWMISHPLDELHLTSARFVALWSGGSTNPLTDIRHGRGARTYFVILFNLLAAFGAAAGIVVLWRTSSPFAVPLSAFPVVFPLIYYLALAPPRYRHPIDPVLLLLTAIAIAHLPNYRKRPVPPPA